MRQLRLMVFVAFLMFISVLPAGKGGSGRQSQAAGGSFVQATVDGRTFTHNLTPGELAENARTALAALINADPNFQASATTLPGGIFEGDDVLFQVLKTGGGEITSLIVCENDGTYQNSGIHIAGGRPRTEILKPTAVAGGGTFNLRFDMATGSDVDETWVTSEGDVSGLISAIISTLEGLNFKVVDNGAYLLVVSLNDAFVSTRVTSTDTLIKHTCAGIINAGAPVGIPTLQSTGVVALMAGLLLAGILMLRRKARA